MMMLLKIVLLFFAVAVAMLLVMRLTRIQQKLADLHKDLGAKDAEMARQRLEIERLAAAQQAQDDALKN